MNNGKPNDLARTIRVKQMKLFLMMIVLAFASLIFVPFIIISFSSFGLAKLLVIIGDISAKPVKWIAAFYHKILDYAGIPKS